MSDTTVKRASFGSQGDDGSAVERWVGVGGHLVGVGFISADDGKTWAAPTEITGSAKQPDWTWYATGPASCSAWC